MYPGNEYTCVLDLDINSETLDTYTILVSVINPSGTTVLANQTPTLVDGKYEYTYTFASDADLGTWTFKWSFMVEDRESFTVTCNVPVSKLYCTVEQARKYCKQAKHVTDNDIIECIESAINEDINPVLSKQYDITSSEVFDSPLVSEVTAIGAGLKVLNDEYAASPKSGLSADIDKLSTIYDLLLFEISTGKKKV